MKPFCRRRRGRRYRRRGLAAVILTVVASCTFGPNSAAAQGTTRSSDDQGADDQGTDQWDASLAAATFDAAWNRIHDTYYDPEMGDLDWDAVRDELRPQAVEAGTTERLRDVLRELVSRIGESHFAIIPGPSAAAFEVAQVDSGEGSSEPGLDLRWVEGQVVVSRIRAGSPAEEAGIRPGWILDAVDELPTDTVAAWVREGAPAGGEDRHLSLWLPVGVRNRLAGAEGTFVTVELRDESDRTHRLDLLRAAPAGGEFRLGNLPPIRMETSHRVESLADGRRVGVIRLSAWFPPAVPAFAEAMEQLRAVDGIVLDVRGNPGGLAVLVMGIGGYFLEDALSLGTMRTRDTTLRFVVNPQRVTTDGRRVEPYAGPLAILIDPLSASTSEIFAGGMQSLGRARIFGEPSAGQALPALVSELPNGDRLLHVVADFTAANDVRLEGRGVVPDVHAAPTRAALLAGQDLALDEAVRWMQTRP